MTNDELIDVLKGPQLTIVDIEDIIDDSQECIGFSANATDKYGNSYTIVWDALPGYPPAVKDMADWDNPSAVYHADNIITAYTLTDVLLTVDTKLWYL